MYFSVMPRVDLIVILMTYVCYLYSINCPTIICLLSMLLFILWRDTTSELWTPVEFPLHCYYRLLLLALFTFLQTITFYHSICSILCLQQTGEIDNLIVSWGQSFCVLCAGSTLLLVKSFTPTVFFWRRCLKCRKASKHLLLKFGFLLLVR
jgi:hypothetical protein